VEAARTPAARHLGHSLDWLQPQGGSQDLPKARLAGTLPQEAQEADHRWDPPRLRIRLARLLPCAPAPPLLLGCLPRTCSSAPPVARALPRRDRQIRAWPACGTIAPELSSGHGGLLACCETRPLSLPPPALPPLLPGRSQCTLYIPIPLGLGPINIGRPEASLFSKRLAS